MKCPFITRLFLLFIAVQALNGCAYLPLWNPVTPAPKVQAKALTQPPQPLQVLEECRRLETDLTMPYSKRQFSCRKPQSRLSVPLNMSFTPALRSRNPRAPSTTQSSTQGIPKTRPTIRFISFSSGRSTPDDFGLSVLKLTLSVAKQAKQIVIQGSTDSTGSTYFNDRLAMKRAKYVFDQFTTHGIDQSKISLLGRDRLKNQRAVQVELFF